MSKRLLLILVLLAGLCSLNSLWAEEFSVIPTIDLELGNDTSLSATSRSNGSGMGIRNIEARRRVSVVVYDISEVKAMGAYFTDVKLSNYGYNLSDDVDVYGVLEEYESLVDDSVSWSTCPGLQNDPLPDVGSAVELDEDDLTDLLITFTPPGNGERGETEVSDALADFLNADTTGIVVLLFAPPEDGSQTILRTIGLTDGDEIVGGSWLVGDIGGSVTVATKPSPSVGLEDVYSATDLSWTAGADAETHTLYLSTDFNDVNDGAVSALEAEGLTETSYTPELSFGATYYWRVDEVGDETYAGAVWNFTVEPEFYTIEDVNATASSMESEAKGPENVVNGSGLTGDTHDKTSTNMWISADSDDSPWIEFAFDRVYSLAQMKVWNYNGDYESFLGYGIKDVLIETSVDAETWVEFADVNEFAQGIGANDYVLNNLFDMQGVKAQYVRFTVLDNFSAEQPLAGLSEVQFTYTPTFARVIAPVDGAADVDVEPQLAWRAGRGAVQHTVYLGDDADLVEARDASTLLETIVGDELSVDSLVVDTNYYWAVDAVFEADVVSGELWSFTTPEYINLEDFDSYSSACTRIYYFWRDGFGYDADEDCGISSFSGNGSSPSCYVGYIDPDDNGSYAETSATYAGAQSMPFEYNNTESPYYSEAQAQDDLLASDWTVGDAENLTLFVKGSPADMVEVSDDHLIISGMGGDMFDSPDEGRYVYKTLTGDGTIVARVVSLDNTNDWAKAGLMIRSDADDAEATNVMVYVSPGNGLRIQYRSASGGSGASDTSTASDEQKAVEAPIWLKLERVGNEFSAYYSTEETATNWVAASGNPVTVPMISKVAVGMAVTSHEDGVTALAEFSDIATTGSVSGSWTAVALGVDQPVNSAESMYVTVTDSKSKTAKVTHDNAEITQVGTWQQWDIPLSTLSDAGVDLTQIKTMAVGVGTGSSSDGGTGVVLIDEIRLTRPAD